MSLALNRSLSMDSSGPQVTEWEPAADMAPTVSIAIILIGVLTFALQLGLALYLMMKCWSYDKRIQQDAKELGKVPSGVHPYKLADKQPHCLQHWEEAAAGAAAQSVTLQPHRLHHWDEEAAQSITLQSMQTIYGEYICYNSREYWDLLQR